MVYISLFIILSSLSYLSVIKKLNRTSNCIMFYTLFILFWLVAGLRFETGVDWPGYTYFFNQSKGLNELSITDSFEFELGFIILNSVIKTFSDNVQTLFLVCAYISSMLLFMSVKKYSTYPFISLLVYFCTIYFVLDMSGIRQCISLNIFLISLQYLYDKKFTKYLLLISLATLFHTSAILLLPLFFLINYRFQSIVILIILLFGIIIAWNRINWISPILEIIFDASFSIDAITNKLYGYNNRNANREFGIGFFLNLFVFLFFLYFRNRLEHKKMFNVFLNMSFISLIFYYYIWEITEISSRYRLYFSTANMFLFPFLIDISKIQIKKILCLLFIVTFSAFFGRIYLFQMDEGLAYNPYQNYVIYKIFDLNSTGKERLQKFAKEVGENPAP